MTAECYYAIDGWSCRAGQLLPGFEVPNFMSSPCPACNTRLFLELAYRRSNKIEESSPCPFCFLSGGQQSLGWQIALDTATPLNPLLVSEILQEIELNTCSNPPKVSFGYKNNT